MKVLWFCNVVLPMLGDAAGLKEKANSAGWIEGVLEEIQAYNDIELGIICQSAHKVKGTCSNGIRYWFGNSKEDMETALNEFAPDILHIFGTENVQSNVLFKLYKNPQRTVVNIQGMAGLYGEVYLDGMPPKLQLRGNLYEKCIRCGLIDQKKRFFRRGLLEEETIKNIGHVIGRTDIDKMFATSLNPNIHYHYCNEILRKDFYIGDKWDISKAKKHAILFRNTCNPIKGFYQMLCAMPHILKIYPDAHLYVVGDTYISPRSIIQKIKEKSYNKLLRKTVDKYSLEKNITALGSLDVEQMRRAFLQSHVAVSASVIENESNFVSEAKLLGVPVVSSYVGGLPNRIRHGIDGFLYPFNMPKMLAYYVTQIFKDDNVAQMLSESAIVSQTYINDPKRNITELVDIYSKILATK